MGIFNNTFATRDPKLLEIISRRVQNVNYRVTIPNNTKNFSISKIDNLRVCLPYMVITGTNHLFSTFDPVELELRSKRHFAANT